MDGGHLPGSEVSARMTNLIEQARMAYLAVQPFDPAKNAVMAQNGNGDPAGFMTFPDIGEMQILAAKLGMEYLAICSDDEAVEKWIDTCLGLAKSPELVGILFANVFRGINIIVGGILDTAGMSAKIRELAVEAWSIDFTDKFGGAS